MSQFVTQPSGNLKPIWTFLIFQLSHFDNACAICDLTWLHTWMHFRFDPIYAHGSSGPQGIIWRCSEIWCSHVVSEFSMGTRYKKLAPSQGFAKAHRHPPPLCRCAWDSSLASHPRQSAPSWSGLPGPKVTIWNILRSTKNMMCKIHQNSLTIPDWHSFHSPRCGDLMRFVGSLRQMYYVYDVYVSFCIILYPLLPWQCGSPLVSSSLFRFQCQSIST